MVGAVAGPGRALAGPELRRPAPERVYVLVYDADRVTETDRRYLEDAAARGVRGDGAVTALTPERSAGESPEAALKAGDDGLAKAREQVKNLDLDAAIETLTKVVTTYRDNLPDLVLRDGNAGKLVAGYRDLAIARFLNGDDDGAERSLAHVFVLQPDLVYNQKDFPPQMMEVVMSAGLLAGELGRGSLEISVTGGDAEVYVNGDEHGRAPVKVDDLPGGPNIVNVVAPGTPTVTVEVEVDSGATEPVEIEVLPPPVAIPDALADVRGDIGASEASAKLRGLATTLGVEALVLIVPARGDGGVSLEGYVYDLRTGRLAGKATGTDPVQVGGALFNTADWGTIEQPVESVPIWNPRHKYFWHAVGATAGVATVITVGIIASRSGGLSPGEKVVVFGLGTKF